MEKESGATAPLKWRSGLVLGKFLPFHMGHHYLISRALQQVDELTVLVGTLAREPIPGLLRYQWVKETFPQARVCHLTDENPQEPADHPDFWDIWVASIRRFCPVGPEVVFSSEAYGYELARRLGAIHVPVDIQRKHVPISGTMIRANPYLYWEFLPPLVRPYYVKKLVIYGPESTGKTTLAQKLAAALQTQWVPEYARDMLDKKGTPVELTDIDDIARGQMRLEDETLRQAHKIMICDSDLITTAIYSQHFFNTCPQWIIDEGNRRTYDLYLLMNIDVPWVPDPQRDTGHRRQEFFQIFKNHLDIRQRPYVIVSGNYEERFQQALTIAQQMIQTNTP